MCISPWLVVAISEKAISIVPEIPRSRGSKGVCSTHAGISPGSSSETRGFWSSSVGIPVWNIVWTFVDTMVFLTWSIGTRYVNLIFNFVVEGPK